MDPTYEIFTDMAVDIDPETAGQYDIRYIPMEYSLGEKEYYCTEPAGYDQMMDFYDQLRHKLPTSTSQINPQNYIDVFTGHLKEGKAILYIALTSGLSNTYNSALASVRILKEDFPDAQIEVIDSACATIGQGLLTELACRNREQGMSLQDNAAWLRSHAVNINHWFKVSDLFYLMRGGRISAPTAVMGSALNLKPILTVTAAGKLEVTARKRGDSQALKHLLSLFEERFDPSMGKAAYICGAGCPDDIAQLKEALLQIDPELTIHATMLCPIIGAHTGPDMLGLVFYGTARE